VHYSIKISISESTLVQWTSVIYRFYDTLLIGDQKFLREQGHLFDVDKQTQSTVYISTEHCFYTEKQSVINQSFSSQIFERECNKNCVDRSSIRHWRSSSQRICLSAFYSNDLLKMYSISMEIFAKYPSQQILTHGRVTHLIYPTLLSMELSLQPSFNWLINKKQIDCSLTAFDKHHLTCNWPLNHFPVLLASVYRNISK
jgi:hypothetical protein